MAPVGLCATRRNAYRPSGWTFPFSIPLQVTVCFSPGATASAVQVWRTEPSDTRTRVTETESGVLSASRYENATPAAESNRYLPVVTAVSIWGEPGSAGPRAAVRLGLGCGGGDGTTVSRFDGLEWTRALTHAESGPLEAEYGTLTERLVSLFG